MQPVMLRLARPAANLAQRQVAARVALSQRRTYAERNDTLLSSDPAFKPESPGANKPASPTSLAGSTVSSKTAIPVTPGGQAVPGAAAVPTSSRFPNTPAASATPATPASPTPSTASTVPIPGTKPEPVQTVVPPVSTGTTATTPPPSPPPPPPPPPPAPRSRGLRFLVYTLGLLIVAYGGSVFYALRNDNFHDFFTEYVPFGEDAVLYFEERQFRKRFPQARQQTYKVPPPKKDVDDSKVTIPKKSGLSWKVSEGDDKKGSSDATQKGKHMSAVDANKPSKDAVAVAKQDPAGATGKEKVAAVEKAKKDAGSPVSPRVISSKEDKDAKSSAPPARSAEQAPKTEAKTTPPLPSTPSTPAPSSDTRPPAIAPVTQISNVEIANANEPVVQDLVKILNDLITVVNSDSADAANRYSAPMNKAKESLTAVAAKISTLRDAERKAAEERVQQAHKEFDEGARQLLQRIETAQREDDAKYREEFEHVRAQLAENYEKRLQNEVQRTQDVAEQKYNNQLTEQAIEMKRNFISEIRSLVESERDGRLSKLSDLSTNVDSLTELTSNWNGVIDSNLQTQKLQVAVDTVRSAVENHNSSETSKPRPFVREMAALKLVADGDPIVDAAIGSINPSAYQRGIPSQPQLIDRFRRVASEVRKASLLPEGSGIASHAASLLLSKVMFKKHGQPQGGDVESILTRTETLLEEGDLDAAAREMNGLQGWAKVLSKDWLSDARKVLEVKQALEVIETEAKLQCLRVS